MSEKTINGLVYKSNYCSNSEALARSEAAKQRRTGNYARVIQSRTGRWCVYSSPHSGVSVDPKVARRSTKIFKSAQAAQKAEAEAKANLAAIQAEKKRLSAQKSAATRKKNKAKK